MIFTNPPKLPSATGIVKFLSVDLYSWMKSLFTGLLKLDFKDNFDTFTTKDLTIPAGEEVLITNQLGSIPQSRIITRQTGNGLVTDGVWDLQTLRLFNNGAVDVVITVIFFR
jgi:hypothetical protein